MGLTKGDAEAVEWSKSTSDQTQNGKHCPNWKWLNSNNSAVDCPVLLKFSVGCIMGLQRWNCDRNKNQQWLQFWISFPGYISARVKI